MRLLDYRIRRPGAIALSFALALGVATGPDLSAATFAPIAGTLSIRAGSHAPQTTPATIGTASLTDFELPIAVASASLQTSLRGGSQFNFSATATSSTNVATPASPPNATASTNFEQAFTTTAQQWIQLTANVLSPADPGVSGFVTFGQTGHAPVYTIGDSANQNVIRNALFPPGSYSVVGTINTQAAVAPAHAGAVSGFLLIAALGDFNGNSTVDAADVAAWRAGFGSTSGTFASGNLDGDSDSDGADFLLLQRQVGTHAFATATGAAVPEPAALLSSLVGACVFASRVHCRTRRSAAWRAIKSPAE
jgi:hypothetical protein